MPFKKGVSGHPSGRPKGSKNKPKKASGDKLNDHVNSIKQVLNKASQKERSEFLLSISSVILSNNGEIKPQQIQP